MRKYGKLNIHRGSQCWYCRIDGVMVYLTKKGGTKDEAELKLAQLRILNAATEQNNKTNDQETLNKLFALYLAEIVPTVSVHNGKEKTRLINLFLATFGEKSGADNFTIDIERWLAGHTGWSDSYKVVVLAHINAAFRWCQRKLKTTSNPISDVDKPRKSIRGEEYLVTEEEYARLLKVTAPRYKPILQLLWLTGARPGEILQATGAEYQGKDHCINKVEHKTKHKGKTRKILLVDEAESIILAAIAKHGDGLLFPGASNNKISPCHFSQILRPIGKKAGIKHPLIPYSFRHSFACRHIERMIPINIVASWLGNTVAVCERHYAHALERVANTRKYMS